MALTETDAPLDGILDTAQVRARAFDELFVLPYGKLFAFHTVSCSRFFNAM
jgi:hypothetical protein